ncbi:hypothetical protein [Bathymodiolus platifrons methanotrophic gill symbiont]|uniref:hypothetical protein n=1 Tax=Bathymodiolus platifrons methanotrophic gill symbiont TaxID=113268 RepID=UPI00142D5FF6|nr:hypothetical protein [Bathymodiolus platifrons methanotrophic gill symbiont]
MKDTRIKIRVYFILFVFLNCLKGTLVTAGGFGSADGGTGFGSWDTQEVEEVEKPMPR